MAVIKRILARCFEGTNKIRTTKKQKNLIALSRHIFKQMFKSNQKPVFVCRLFCSYENNAYFCA